MVEKRVGRKLVHWWLECSSDDQTHSEDVKLWGFGVDAFKPKNFSARGLSWWVNALGVEEYGTNLKDPDGINPQLSTVIFNQLINHYLWTSIPLS